MIGIGISIPMMMPFAEDATTFVRPGVLRDPFTITRAQLAGVQSSAINGTNDGLTLYGADVPRFTGSAQRLLIEGQQTNTSPNPNCEGAVPGTPGTLPSSWLGWPSGNGLTRQVVGSGNENGIPFVDIRFSGTTTLTTFNRVNFNTTAAQLPVVTNGDRVVSSVYVRLVSGSTAGVNTFRTSTYGLDSTEVFVGGQLVQQNFMPTSASLNSQRRVGLYQVTDASVVKVILSLDFTYTSEAVIDFTVRVGSPQLRLGAFADTDVFPPVGTPGASTRGADVVAASLSSLGIAANGACTVLWSGVLPQLNTTTGLTHFICAIDDNSLNNRYVLRNSVGASLNIERIIGGVSSQTSSGTLTAGAPFAAGICIDGSGRMAASLNAASVFAVTGGPISGLATFRLGSNHAGGSNMFGETARLRILPYSVSDAELQSLVGALP